MSRPARISPDRILDAAAAEFADRGFGGARVDRIARRARVNKAMLYYHFQNKQALYRALLRRTFGIAAERIRTIGRLAVSPPEKIDRVIGGFADLIRDHEYLPSIMLREVAERGAHLDRETLRALVEVPRAVGEIVQEGVAHGSFRAVHPVFAHITMLAPVVFYTAAASIRQELNTLGPSGLMPPPAEEFVRHMQDLMRRALAPSPERSLS